MNRTLLRLAALLCLLNGYAHAADAFAAGQTWTYKTRASEPQSRLVIRRIDEYPKVGRIVHVTIVNLVLRRTPGGKEEPWQLAHAPIAEAALRKSVGKLETQPAGVLEDNFEPSYAQWKEQAERGNVQHWNVQAPAIVRQVEEWIVKGRK
jgi:hypothetical protein